MAYDFKVNTVSIGITAADVLSATPDPFIEAVFHNLDGTNTIYLGKSDVVTDGTNGFGLQPGDMVEWHAHGDLSEIYAIAGGGTALKLSYVIYK